MEGVYVTDSRQRYDQVVRVLGDLRVRGPYGVKQLSHLHTCKYSFVLVDSRLEGEMLDNDGGIEVLKQLRATANAESPIIMMYSSFPEIKMPAGWEDRVRKNDAIPFDSWTKTGEELEKLVQSLI